MTTPRPAVSREAQLDHDVDLLHRWIHRDRETLHQLRRALGLGPPQGIDYLVGAEALARWAQATLDDIERQLADHHDRDADRSSGLGPAVVAVEMYFVALQGWENSDNYRALKRYVVHASAWLQQRTALGGVERAIMQLLDSLSFQMDTEDARFCACPASLTTTAQAAAASLSAVELGARATDDESSLAPHAAHNIDLLASLLRVDRHNDQRYFEALAQQVGPLANDYVTGLAESHQAPIETSNQLVPWRRELEQRIQKDVPGLRTTAQELIDIGEVLGTELRAHCNALDAIAASLHRDTLLFTGGRLVFLYPFTLPLGAAWSRDESREEGQQWRVGFRGSTNDDSAPDGASRRVEPNVDLRFDTMDRTDAWEILAREQTRLSDLGALRLSTEFSLRLRPSWAMRSKHADERFYEDLDIIVVLGEGGQHYVKIVGWIGRENPSDDPDRDADASPLRPDGDALVDELRSRRAPWSGHECDQWVRRLSKDAGSEEVKLVRGTGPDATVVATYQTMHELASDMVRAVRHIDRREFGGSPQLGDDGATARIDKGDDERIVRGFSNAAVVFVVDDAEVLAPNGARRQWTTDDDLTSLVGFPAITTGHRYLPSAVEEWTTLARAQRTDLLSDIHVHGDSLYVDGEVITLFARSSPNWIVIEQIEMIEFAVSIRARVTALTDRVDESATDDQNAGPDVKEPSPRQLQARIRLLTSEIDRGTSVLELMRSRDLVRSPYHRNFLDRMLQGLDIGRAEQRLIHLLEALDEQRSSLVEQQRHQDSMRLDRLVLILTYIALFTAVEPLIAIGLVGDSIGRHAIASGATFALLTVIYLVYRWRDRRE